MKKSVMACLLLLTLTACLPTAPKYTAEQLQRINSIDFVKFENLPHDKHIKIIGTTKGNYGTKYGKKSEMIWEMKVGAYNLNGDAILPYSTSSQYISMANATIINGTASVVSYVDPEKNLILADYASGYRDGYIALSAARFAGNYHESESISKKIIESSGSYKDGDVMVSSALNVLAKVSGRNSIDYFFDYIINSGDRNSLNALMAISPYINKQDKEKLVRFLKFHRNEDIKIEAARLLLRHGERQVVENYAEISNNSSIAKLLM